MEKLEKSILKNIYFIVMLLFLILSLYRGSFEIVPFVYGTLSVILIAYGYFVIKKYYPRVDKYLYIISVFIVEFGLVMLYRLDFQRALKQLIWFAIGIMLFIFILILFPDIKRLQKYSMFFAIFNLVLLTMPLLLGREIKGSKNWIQVGSLSFQPSELAKIFMIFYLSDVIRKIKDYKDVLKYSIPIVLSIAIFVLEKDLGSALMFFGMFMAMLYVGTSRLRYILSGLVLFVLGGFFSYVVFDHVKRRINIWLNPWKDKYGAGYQICQSLIAIASGGLFGTGLAGGHPEVIPEVHTDFIFSAIAEEFGLLGAIALLILYLLLIYRMLRTALYAKEDYSRLVAVGIASMFAFQVFVIVGGVTKMIPLTGITLPFVSYGGSSMIINFLAIGILQKISEVGNEDA
ncbi:cell division protein FtsW, lipid II flippase [Caloramator fervidus]|uniref:Cell division protein FtsW, lipid II flippase n=1 Tax=Caloramator fervidus TaxID=29344 RepID=A0A1H5TCM9_9CLOT|nr:FtsW/RodA/SpoVE family cell cycle protein [Caloramator fervidus]SEF59851.1 cell division protein FtsW, lipid II flippase [Caloramator fervidus]